MSIKTKKISRRRLPIEERQRLVLLAAVELLKSGTDSVTVVGIARQLDWSVSAVTRCYRYRSDILLALLDYADQSMSEVFSQLRERYREDGLEFTRQLFYYFVTFTDTNPGFDRLLTGRDFQKEDQQLGERLLKLHTSWETWIRECMKLSILHEQVPVTYEARSRAFMLFNVLVGRWTRSSMKAQVPTIDALMPSVNALLTGQTER